MSHTSMQWLRASATTVALALALGTPLDAHAAAEDPFFAALDRYGADDFRDRKSTRLNSSHPSRSRMPSSA